MTHYLPFQRTLLSSILILSASGQAIAQGQEIEEIVVKGEKVTRSLQKTISSVGVLTSEQIQESSIYDIQEAFDRIANVNGAQGNEGFTIRGINSRAVGAAGTSGLASLNIDGAFISARGIRVGQKDLWDFDQVEVFRGPQSTNQGRNSLAGAIILRSSDPTFTPESAYRLSYGTDNTQIVSFAHSNALIEDELAYRISIDDQETDGFINNRTLNDDEYGGSSNTTIRTKLLYEPSAVEGLSVLATLSYSENESGDAFSSLIDENGASISPFDGDVFANIEGFENFDQTIAVIETNYDINDFWSVTSITSWNEGEYRRQDDSDRQAGAGPAFRSRSDDITTFTQEIRFSYNTDSLQGNIGFYYFDQEDDRDINDLIDQDVRQQILQIIPVSFPQLSPFATTIAGLYPELVFVDRDGTVERDIENYAVFANINYDVNDFVTLFAGLRYDTEEVRNASNEVRTIVTELPDPAFFTAPLDQAVVQVNALIASLADFEELENESDYSAFLPKVGITLNWNDDLSTSFTVQRAYRAGGAGTTTNRNFEFDPEFTTNYDLALRSQWFDRRLTVNANAFYVDWTDQQVQISEPISQLEFITVNAGESELKGAEIEISAIANDQLDFYANVGYVETEFTEFPIDENLNNQDFTSNEFPNAPTLTASSGFVYRFNDDLRMQMDINYQEASFDNANNDLENDSRTITNAKVTYHVTPNIELAIAARNLFDKEYIIQNDVPRDNVVNIGQPRNLLFQIQGSF